MSEATAVLIPGETVILPPAGNISFEIEAGQRLKLSQPEGEQVADLISFNREDTRELLSMLCSRAVNLSAVPFMVRFLSDNIDNPLRPEDCVLQEDLTETIEF